jgi:hypothetical protein
MLMKNNKTLAELLIKEVLVNLDIDGLSKASTIVTDTIDKYEDEVTVVRGKRFEVIYYKDTMTLEVNTTSSNQPVDEMFLEELQIIMSKKNLIKATLDMILVENK